MEVVSALIGLRRDVWLIPGKGVALLKWIVPFLGTKSSVSLKSFHARRFDYTAVSAGLPLVATCRGNSHKLLAHAPAFVTLVIPMAERQNDANARTTWRCSSVRRPSARRWHCAACNQWG